MRIIFYQWIFLCYRGSLSLYHYSNCEAYRSWVSL